MSRAAPLSPDDRRATLLAAARSVFARRGYHQAGVSDVIEAAGVARGTFYNHFESKRKVFQAVLEELMLEITSVVVPIDVSAPIAPQVEGNLERLVRAIARPEVCRVVFAEAPGIDAEADHTLVAFYDAAFSRIATALARGQSLGVVRPGDPALMARCLVGAVKEPALQADLRREAIDVEGLVKEIRGILGVR